MCAGRLLSVGLIKEIELVNSRLEGERIPVARLRALWTALKARPLLLVPVWVWRWLVPVAAGGAVGAVVAALVPDVLPAVAAGLVAGGVAVALQTAEPDGSLAPLADEELHRLVAEVAAELGVRRPRRVCAWARPDALAVRVAPWRDELRLGLPYLTEMHRDELRAVVAFELALLALRRSPLAYALHRWWLTDSWRWRTVPDEVEAAVDGMFRSADAAAARVAGVPGCASALLRGGLITNSFIWFAGWYGGMAVMAGGFSPDLYANWRWKARHDGLLTAFVRTVAQADSSASPTGRIAAVTGEEPATVAARIAALTAADVAAPMMGVVVGERPAATADGVGVQTADAGSAVLAGGLPEQVETRLARAWTREVHTRPAARAVPLREVPDRTWDEVYEGERAEVLAAARVLLGRREATSQDVVDLARAGRAGELAWDHLGSLCSHGDPAVCVLYPVLHRQLREAGHAYAHPLARRILIAPDGTRVDVAAHAAEIAAAT
ncbi:hypothetical protein [Nonomuraea antimicrobica]